MEELQQRVSDAENAFYSIEWLERLAETWRLTELDRVAVNTVVKRITVFSDGAIEISYIWSE